MSKTYPMSSEYPWVCLPFSNTGNLELAMDICSKFAKSQNVVASSYVSMLLVYVPQGDSSAHDSEFTADLDRSPGVAQFSATVSSSDLCPWINSKAS